MSEWTSLTGRPYGLIDAYLTDDAEHIVVAMGTIADSAARRRRLPARARDGAPARSA